MRGHSNHMWSIVPGKAKPLKHSSEVDGYILARLVGTYYHLNITLTFASNKETFSIPLNKIPKLEYQISGSSEKTRSLSHANIY